MATLKTTLTLTANASTSSRTPGPISFPISLSVTDDLTVDTTTSNHFTTSGTTQKMIDGSALDTTSPAGVAGTSGCYIYMKNTDSTDSVMVGFDADDETGDLGTSRNDGLRFMTLKPLEFAFFPYDYCGDITVEATANAPIVEYWIFDR
tara:strand:- start:184 stop:630 length:447 start_codon:yes stop_codon:yes gene_type:complete